MVTLLISIYQVPRRTNTAKRFLSKALRSIPEYAHPSNINTDKNPTYAKAIAKLQAEGLCSLALEHRQIKYLNNIIESDHSKLKRLIKPALGLWIRENGGDKFPLNNFTKMKNRGLKDILIACNDNLTGMSEATVYPKMQASVVYQSLAEVSYKDRKEIAADLKLAYSSIAEGEAQARLI